jgi:hypothetical protein
MGADAAGAAGPGTGAAGAGAAGPGAASDRGSRPSSPALGVPCSVIDLTRP